MKRFFGSLLHIISLLAIILSLIVILNISKRLIEPCPSSRSKSPAKALCNYELVDRSKWVSEKPEWIVTTNFKGAFEVLICTGLVAFVTYKFGKRLKK